jgi:hypothetical protein
MIVKFGWLYSIHANMRLLMASSISAVYFFGYERNYPIALNNCQLSPMKIRLTRVVEYQRQVHLISTTLVIQLL